MNEFWNENGFCLSITPSRDDVVVVVGTQSPSVNFDDKVDCVSPFGFEMDVNVGLADAAGRDRWDFAIAVSVQIGGVDKRNHSVTGERQVSFDDAEEA